MVVLCGVWWFEVDCGWCSGFGVRFLIGLDFLKSFVVVGGWGKRCSGVSLGLFIVSGG